ncbi:MAG: DUF4147 domain-containing protein [Clostridia bacterium]|nr:DUF4147 domain-containing protein [Clostridia bacterium]
MSLVADAKAIAGAAIKAALPYENTLRAVLSLGGLKNVTALALGKAAAPMASAAVDVLGGRIKKGLLITKYGHAEGFSSPNFEVIEAGHPVSDDNSERAAKAALDLCRALGKDDVLLVLLSGGGSALMEAPRVPSGVQRAITERLLARGADIREMNLVRRRLSRVKGGRLAAAAYPAKVITLALSDVPGGGPEDIASGPTVPDKPDNGALDRVLNRYLFDVPQEILSLLPREVKDLRINDGGFYIVGDMNTLVSGAENEAKRLGYTPHVVTAALSGEARDRAVEIIKETPDLPGRHAYLYAGETTVTLLGDGKGGRNQEMALAAAIALQGKEHIAFLAVGSDGTDGPTDAAGGAVDGSTAEKMRAAGADPEKALSNNDSYAALKASGALLVTGPTGTNVNDLVIVLTEE